MFGVRPGFPPLLSESDCYSCLVMTRLTIVGPPTKLSLERSSLNLTDEFTEKDKATFKDPAYYNKFRRDIEREMNVCHILFLLLQVLKYAACTPSHSAGKSDDTRSTRRIQEDDATEARQETMDSRS